MHTIKINTKEKNYIIGIFNYYIGYGLFSTNLNHIKLYDNIMDCNLNKNKYISIDDIKYFSKKENLKKLEDKCNDDIKKFNDRVKTYGILIWFNENKIVQVKRPDTWGNKGDYNNDSKKSEEYQNNPLFVKFKSIKDFYNYTTMIEDYNNGELYKSWFIENERNFFSFNMNTFKIKN